MTHSYARWPQWIVDSVSLAQPERTDESDDVYAIEWLYTFKRKQAGHLSYLGYRWLLGAIKHLEDRVDRELRPAAGA